ncbi:hypothetical protein EVAR_57297_1 [Eumeta japonica]|uniref:Uncharacterized protein n=1 Tax=Eumeta variegata TaxID=151549 RepID=A0A4C1YPF3_EUMVA|nr:hypothetical protein EVAR_57297_1 [Eumeta japonica]
MIQKQGHRVPCELEPEILNGIFSCVNYYFNGRKEKKIIMDYRNDINIVCKTKYPWFEASSLYWVGSAGVNYYELLKPNEAYHREIAIVFN